MKCVLGVKQCFWKLRVFWSFWPTFLLLFNYTRTVFGETAVHGGNAVQCRVKGPNSNTNNHYGQITVTTKRTDQAASVPELVRGEEGITYSLLLPLPQYLPSRRTLIRTQFGFWAGSLACGLVIYFNQSTINLLAFIVTIRNGESRFLRSRPSCLPSHLLLCA